MLKTVNGPFGPVTGEEIEWNALGAIKIRTFTGQILTKSNVLLDYWS